MRKSIRISLCATMVLMLASSSAMADKKDEIIKSLIERLDKVEKELTEIKGETKYLRGETENIKKDTEEQVEELHARADENEFQSALNKVKFGFDMETSVNFLDGDYNAQEVDSKEKWTSVFHLNMSANINERTKFNGRIGVSRNWSDYTLDTTNDYNQGRNSSGGTNLFLERAYLDYKLSDNFIVTIGRQPGSDGPGSNLKNNSSRQATYPALLFSANGDGVVLTYKPKIPSLENSAVRLIYAKMYQWDDGTSFLGKEEIDDARIYGAMLETKLPLGLMGDNLMILWGVTADKVTINASSSGLGSLNIGDLSYANLYFENNNAFGTNLNYFISGAMMKGSNAVDNSALIASRISSSENQAAAYLAALAATGDHATAQQLAAQRLQQSAQQAIAGTKLNEEDAWAVHVGARYDFNDQWKLGYQFFHGSKYWYSFQAASVSDPLNITQTRGDAHDIYLIYQIDFNQFLRLGYTYVNYDYTGSGYPFGGTQKTDDTVKNIMLTYNIRF